MESKLSQNSKVKQKIIKKIRNGKEENFSGIRDVIVTLPKQRN